MGTAALTAHVLSSLLKAAVGRERPPGVVLEPEPLLDVPATESFPSGHASTAFACAVVLARIQPWLAVPVYALAVLIAWSRVYVGVHYPLDVLGGALLGTLVATALLMLRAALRRSRRSPRAG